MRFHGEPPLVGKWCGERTREIALTVSAQASAWEGDCPISPLDRGSTNSAILSCTRGDRPVRGATRKACHNCPFSTAVDGWVTDAQVRRLREKRMAGKTLAAAAASAGMSERTARKWRSGPSTVKAPRIDAGEGGR